MIVIAFFTVVFQALLLLGNAYNVTFDHRAFLINGERTLLIAGSIHYPRAHSAEWPSILSLAKASGVNLIQTYVFWDIHEPEDGLFYFPNDGSSEDLVAFLTECKKQGLYVNLRFGPYVCAEWSYGGFPGWLREVPEITFRTMNKPFLHRMLRFIDQTLAVVQDAQLLASEDGPVIMLQIENEYGNMQRYYPTKGDEYVQFLAEYALQKNLSIPWTMCQQGEGTGSPPPKSVVNTCNGYYCDSWIEEHAADFPNQPHMWTENWPGWFQTWGQPVPHRPAVDVAFAVARWFARGGTYMNYYMLFGGTTFGRHAGGPLIVTSYDYDVQINEYGLPAEPKYSLTKQLHDSLLSVSSVLLTVDEVPPAISLTPSCETHTYQSEGRCAVFLSNFGERDSCIFTVMHTQYEVSPWSVSIVDDACSAAPRLLINTRDNAMKITENKMITTPVPNMSLSEITMFSEPVPTTSAESVTAVSPLDQLSLTQDSTDYLWVSASVKNWDENAPATLSYHYGAAGGPVAYVFVNGVLQASTIDDVSGDRSSALALLRSQVESLPNHVSLQIALHPGDSTIDILSVTTGLKNYGPYLERVQAGITSNVSLNGISLSPYTHNTGLTGEKLKLYDMNDAEAMEYFVPWTTVTPSKPLTWYRAHFFTPASYGAAPLAIDISSSSLVKGSIWINGFMLGRYWTIKARGYCEVCTSESYTGSYNAERCRSGCGDLSQSLYKIPYGLLLPHTGSVNTIVFMDEFGGRPDEIIFQSIAMTK